jgi:hypothetical protein
MGQLNIVETRGGDFMSMDVKWIEAYVNALPDRTGGSSFIWLLLTAGLVWAVIVQAGFGWPVAVVLGLLIVALSRRK